MTPELRKELSRKICQRIAEDVYNLTVQRINHFIPIVDGILAESLLSDAADSGMPAEATPDTAWLIERARLCLGICGYRLKWVTFMDENAIRFSRRSDAYGMLEALKWEPFKMFDQMQGAIVTEHSWGAAPPAASPQPVQYFRTEFCPDCDADISGEENHKCPAASAILTPATPSAPDADTRFDKSLREIAEQKTYWGRMEMLRRRLLPTLQAANGMLQECRCGFDPENCGHCSATSAMEKILEEIWTTK